MRLRCMQQYVQTVLIHNVQHVYNVKLSKMVEENNKPNKIKTNKPKSVYSWNVTDVQKWFRRHCGDYFNFYAENFLQHEINGRTLIRMNDNSLLRLGITDMVHREAVWREILKLRLKTDIMEIRDLQRKNNNNNNNNIYFA